MKGKTTVDRQPEIHRLMVYVATLVLLLALVAYHYHPGDDVLVTVIATALGFLFGKATNGIGGNKATPRRSVSRHGKED